MKGGKNKGLIRVYTAIRGTYDLGSLMDHIRSQIKDTMKLPFYKCIYFVSDEFLMNLCNKLRISGVDNVEGVFKYIKMELLLNPDDILESTFKDHQFGNLMDLKLNLNEGVTTFCSKMVIGMNKITARGKIPDVVSASK